MKRYIWSALFCLSLLVGLAPMASARAAGAMGNPKGTVVIANRNSSTLSLIDVATDTVAAPIALPGTNPAEPMYVVYVKQGKKVFVGDRANNQVVVLDAKTFTIIGSVATGAGVFHMWADAQGKQLWVNNDIDNTSTVIDPRDLSIMTTVPMPADLVAMGYKPHDVVLDEKGDNAFVTLVGGSASNDYVIKFDTQTFQEVGRAPVGNDPHVSLTKHNDFLYVPAQNANTVTVLHRDTLALVTDIPVNGAHGAGMRRDGDVFYTTNLPGGGTGGLVAIDTASNAVIDAVDTPFAVPHNIALTRQGDKIYVTHSGGTSDKVTVYTASKQAPVPVFATEVTVGLNPFGLAYVP